MGKQGEGESDREAEQHGECDQLQVLDGRRPVAIDVFLRPVEAEELVGRLTGQSVRAAFLNEPFADFADGGNEDSASHAAAPSPGAPRSSLLARRGTRR